MILFLPISPNIWSWGNSKLTSIIQNNIESPIIGKDGDPEKPGDDTPSAWNSKYTGTIVITITTMAQIELITVKLQEFTSSVFLSNIQRTGIKLKIKGQIRMMLKPGKYCQNCHKPPKHYWAKVSIHGTHTL